MIITKLNVRMNLLGLAPKSAPLKFAIGMAVMSLASSAALAAFGGMSGGGGNAIVEGPPCQVVPVEYAAKVVLDATHRVAPYLHRERQRVANHKVSSPALVQLFASRIDVVQVALSVSPLIELENACLGSENEPVDGSTLNAGAQHVCISARRLAEKVNGRDLEAQAAALLIHEYSELAGLNEDEAVAVQTTALHDLRRELGGDSVDTGDDRVNTSY